MGTHLQELLRSLCHGGLEWSYAVFWKLKHRARMVLTWEDAYYNNHIKHDPLDTTEILHDGHFAHDPLGLAVAKMSYHVYSLGEGIVGQVAATGNHRWIHADDHLLMNTYPSPELCDGWQAQFSAGIKTIVVAAVVPRGVIQLGSLTKVDEDPKLLTHIRDIFSTLRDTSTSHIQDLMHHNMHNNPVLMKQGDESYGGSLPDIHFSDAVESPGKGVLPEVIDNAKLIQSMSLNQQSTDPYADAQLRINDYMIQNADDYHPGVYGTAAADTSKTQPNFEDVSPSFMFSGCSELHEALGPSFLQHYHQSPHNLNPSSHIPDTTETTTSSMLTSDSSSDNLLEAVIASFYANTGKKAPLSTSESMLTSERMTQRSPSISTNNTIGSSCYSMTSCSSLLEDSPQNSCSIRSSTSTCRDSMSLSMSRSVEPGKPAKKRARPGENSRPRPRDRQLIQDRIKELRELVPNGSKCSIDSLLERTIKHMVFLQSVTKHADKLSSCAKSRGGSNETGVLGSNFEQGSSWAVEVGGHMKICPIVVENLNMNGQMLIEMLCEECDHFLEIAEAIRSLGLTILKGTTDNRGDKTWMRFVVEGQNNRNLHRMDVLWSLVQILQSKTTV